jgi:hypothetical protein
MRRLSRPWIISTVLGCLVLAGTISLFVPFVACSSCSGAGTISVMVSHPEAMGSEMSSTGKLIEVGCSTCDGKARVTLCRKLIGEPPALSKQ